MRFAILGLALLAGCVPAPRGDEPATYIERREALTALEQWTMTGRIGVRLAERGFTGAINWRQAREQLDVRFHGPLGAGAFRLSGQPDALVLETGDGETYLLDDPEATLDAELGWSVPIDAMRYWLLGLPFPAWPAIEELDEVGRLARLEQRDWVVEYDRYTDVGNWLMPRKIVIEGADVIVRLSVHDWILGPRNTEP